MSNSAPSSNEKLTGKKVDENPSTLTFQAKI
jgi:hypothetical protein